MLFQYKKRVSIYQSYSTCLLIIYFILREGGDHDSIYFSNKF